MAREATTPRAWQALLVPFEMRSFVHDDLEISYEIHGSGHRIVVYLHGLLMDTYLNRRLAEHIAARGFRVVLVDFPGHGASGKPRHASAHRIDAYGQHVVHLLDELGVDRAVVGGMSLGANVSLEVALQAPERLRGLIIEMPVLENATPVAAFVFAPLLVATHYAAPVLGLLTGMLRQVPREALGPLAQYVAPLLLHPDEIATVLHGMLVGPVAPTIEQRRTFDIPALVIGHRLDRLHPFTDAHRLAQQLPDAQLIEARSILELRHRPARLTNDITQFLDRVWAEPQARRRSLA